MTEAFTREATGGPLVHLTVQIPEQMRRRLKAAAANDGTSVRAIVEAAIGRDLENRLR
ncbi:hypothetical protein [Pseudactinotalea sp. HY160]|uniref:hypothetical protein n=1 Tax=Pseudactinotalea sp. HY160 TaxID=2654490 RepID=UPI001883390E|nr:hypothetical protein [Pseudactinotalea sp. HY160]